MAETMALGSYESENQQQPTTTTTTTTCTHLWGVHVTQPLLSEHGPRGDPELPAFGGGPPEKVASPTRVGLRTPQIGF